MKKIVAILLVVALMSAMFVVPAHAHEADAVTPRSKLCDDLGGCKQPLAHRTTNATRTILVARCSNESVSHTHTQRGVLDFYICVNAKCKFLNVHIDEMFYVSEEICNS